MIENNLWIKQAENDIKIAFDSKIFEWSIFCSSQAIEKILKSVLPILSQGVSKKELYTHSTQYLIERLPEILKTTQIEIDSKLIDDAVQYSRYPTEHHGGKAPYEMCTEETAKSVLKAVEKLLVYYKDIYVRLLSNFQEFSTPNY